MRRRKVDCLIVGAGFAGVTLAERLTTQAGWHCLLVEKRTHLGGNAYDHYDAHGVLLHAYGPHYFRTNSAQVRNYLSLFTEWHPVDYNIRAWSDGQYWPFPINLNTFEQFLGHPSTTEEMEAWIARHRERIPAPANSEEVIVGQIGREFYEKFFQNYTLKQWGRPARELDVSVCARIPIRTNRDNRYLRESFQALPKLGYTRLFENMVAACGDRLEIVLETNYRELAKEVEFQHLIYTGPIDEFYDQRFGHLPYRSLRFEPEHFDARQLESRRSIAGQPGFWQPAMQVNYPGSEPFTRIVEIKHATGQNCPGSTIVREYPVAGGPKQEPYYPVPAPDARALYQRYRDLAAQERKVTFVGRLATYRYYNMDQVVALALAESERLQQKL